MLIEIILTTWKHPIVFAWLTFIASVKRRAEDDCLLSEDLFRDTLERERMRADRNGHVFALLVFRPRDKTSADALQLLLAHALSTRLRATDIAGSLGGRRVAAILPDTNAAGAWQLADDVLEMLPADVDAPLCSVYEYPANQPQSPLTTNGDEEILSKHSGKEDTVAELLVRATPVWKRVMDVVGSTVGLVVFAPVMLIAAAAIKLSSPGPVFFKQTRAGLGERPFPMYKFRTMVINAEAQRQKLVQFNENDGPAFKMSDDPRITRIGRILRKTSIDELPQLWNVFCGSMSLVGPRPLPCIEAEECRDWQHRRHDVNPGLTCIWQVKGRSIVSFADWARMDLTYVNSRSLGQDLKLLLLTIPAVLSCRGAR